MKYVFEKAEKASANNRNNIFLVIIIIITMLIKALALIILFVGVFSQDNFQQRYIYAGEQDNVCHFGEQSDLIRLKINIDGFETKTIVTFGDTQCDNWILTDALRIIPADYWLAISEDSKEYYLTFTDETKRIYMGGALLTIVQKSTVNNPVTLNGQLYSCVIFGDGQVQHFGINFPNYEPAQIYLKCDKAAADGRETQKQ